MRQAVQPLRASEQKEQTTAQCGQIVFTVSDGRTESMRAVECSAATALLCTK